MASLSKISCSTACPCAASKCGFRRENHILAAGLLIAVVRDQHAHLPIARCGRGIVAILLGCHLLNRHLGVRSCIMYERLFQSPAGGLRLAPEREETQRIPCVQREARSPAPRESVERHCGTVSVRAKQPGPIRCIPFILPLYYPLAEHDSPRYDDCLDREHRAARGSCNFAGCAGTIRGPLRARKSSRKWPKRSKHQERIMAAGKGTAIFPRANRRWIASGSSG